MKAHLAPQNSTQTDQQPYETPSVSSLRRRETHALLGRALPGPTGL